MNTFNFSFPARRSAVALAVAMTCLAAQAQTNKVESQVSVGLGAVDGSPADLAQFGQYNSAREHSLSGILGVEYSLRDPEAGRWVDFTGSNLLGDTRELAFVWKSPGQWKFTANYGELVRHEPNLVYTGLINAGSPVPQVSLVATGAGYELDLKTKRTKLGAGFTRIISPALQVQVDVNSEEKEGSRLFGAYLNGTLTGATPTFPLALMLPEPIKSTHNQIEARVSYALEKFRLNAGYYGSFYSNGNGNLTVGGITPNAVGSNVLALSPDNQAHQLDLSGSYDFNPTTRANFKLAWATATQNDDFASAGLTGPWVTTGGWGGTSVMLNSPGAKVNTTLAKVGITSRPMPKLTLQADWRYENKDDQTPIYNYNLVGTNYQLPNTKVQGKLQATWQLDRDYRGTLGADYEAIDRGTVTASRVIEGISALRQNTDEVGLRTELRRRFADNFSGYVSLSTSKRNGSNWLQPNAAPASGVTEIANPSASFAAGSVFMPTLADRQRDKIKLFADWQVNDQLNLQFNAENGTDHFSAPTANGLRDTRMSQLGVDWSYELSTAWALNGYVSQTTQSLNQSLFSGAALASDNTSQTASIGITGKANSKVQVGASLSYMNDRSVFTQVPDATALAAVAAQLAASGGLPDIAYRQTALKLFATFALEKKSTLRLDLIHLRTSVNDWTWGANGVPFTYSDGTTLSQNADQNVSFVGITYVYQLP